jgi:hypothetical protein
MELEATVLSRISQAQKDRYCIFSLVEARNMDLMEGGKRMVADRD